MNEISKLGKGDFISADECAKLLKVKKTDKNFPLYLMNLKSQIEREFPELTIRSENLGLRILTDVEASEYLANSFSRRYLGMHRDLRRTQQIDQNNLDDDAVERHQRRVEVMSKVIQFAENAVKEMTPLKIEDSTSALPKLFRI